MTPDQLNEIEARAKQMRFHMDGASVQDDVLALVAACRQYRQRNLEASANAVRAETRVKELEADWPTDTITVGVVEPDGKEFP